MADDRMRLASDELVKQFGDVLLNGRLFHRKTEPYPDEKCNEPQNHQQFNRKRIVDRMRLDSRDERRPSAAVRRPARQKAGSADL